MVISNPTHTVIDSRVTYRQTPSYVNKCPNIAIKNALNSKFSNDSHSPTSSHGADIPSRGNYIIGNHIYSLFVRYLLVFRSASFCQQHEMSKRKRKDDRGQECWAFGCQKRFQSEKEGIPLIQSDSSGSSDEESSAKRKVKRSFHQ